MTHLKVSKFVRNIPHGAAPMLRTLGSGVGEHGGSCLWEFTSWKDVALGPHSATHTPGKAVVPVGGARLALEFWV